MADLIFKTQDGKVVTVDNVIPFLGFYDKNGEPIFLGDKVIASKFHATTIYSSKGRSIEVKHVWEVCQGTDSPGFWFKDLGPVEPLKKPIPDSYRHTLLPYFEAKPKHMFWIQKDGKIANQSHYDKIAHLPEAVRYKSMWEVELVK